MFEGMSDAALTRLREPRAIGGRTGWWGLDSSNPLVAGTYEASRWAVDVALTAADLVMAGGEAVAYGLCRPPGHHAARSMAGGYCFFNNAAIAAEAIGRATGEAVAILDVDVHHGNGTEQIFWRRGDVFYASIHADPADLYPFFLGFGDEIGEGPGAGANFNQPLPAGTGDSAYLEAVDRALDAIARTRGSVVVVSLGFDTFEEDPIGTFALTTPVYHEIGRRAAALGRRLVILQEGGYHLPSLGENARAWLRGADGRALDPLPVGAYGPEGARIPT
jgi:acetoin utilization deacetylase AcuC-like enzyme